MTEIDLNFLETHRVEARGWATQAVVRLARFFLWVGKPTRRCIEGWEIPRRPVIFATNHTHVLDFLPLWIELLQQDQRMIGWVKARMYKQGLVRAFTRFLGSNMPLVSRGYLIAADFREVMGRAPNDEEYRTLRDIVDAKGQMPGGEPYNRVCCTRRTMLGRPFRPSRQGYGEAMRSLFFEMMQVTLEKTRRCTDQGYHLHIYPEGQVGRRLTRGHTGIIQAALALSMPIVPVGISGADQVYLGNGPLTRGGAFRLRFGEPFDVDPGVVEQGFRPFHPDDQRRNEEALQAQVDEVMRRLDGLVDQSYRFRPHSKREDDRSVARFY